MKLIKLSQNREYDHLSEKEQIIKIVRRNPYDIKFIPNPSLEVQLEAVKENGLAIKHIQNPSEEVQLAAITGKYATDIIKNIKYYIPKQHPELVKTYTKWVLNQIEVK